MNIRKPKLVYLIDSFGEDVEYYKPEEVDEYTTGLEVKLKIAEEALGYAYNCDHKGERQYAIRQALLKIKGE